MSSSAVPRARLLRAVLLPVVLTVLCALGGSLLYALHAARQFHEGHLARLLGEAAGLVMGPATPVLRAADAAAAHALCAQYRAHGTLRVTLVLPDGRVLGDSHQDPARMDNHAARTELVGARASGEGRAVRTSASVQVPLLYLARAVRGADGALVGFARVAYPAGQAEAARRHILLRIGAAAALALLAAILFGLALAAHLARPLRTLRDAAERFARGDLARPVPLPRVAELADVAAAMNGMAARLDEQLRTVERQRSELQAILRAMQEGVLALDPAGRLAALNPAAARMLRLRPDQVLGQSAVEAIRSPDLLRLIEQTLAAQEPVSGVTQIGNEPVVLHVHGSQLRDARGAVAGALLVLHDISDLRRLESIRRDFVANVSHELKTPITAIQGFVETLLDGAAEDPVHARRFLEIVARNAERLGQIIDDLLNLSRVEQEAERGEVELTVLPVEPVCAAAVALKQARADERQISLVLPESEGTCARVHAPMLELALANLVDNAIRYSPEGSVVRLGVERCDGRVCVHVEDNGPGIPESQHRRIFERFYCVDKARSRELGGTGLGLALVKHIALAHGGTVTLRSVPGAGSRFTIELQGPPAACL